MKYGVSINLDAQGKDLNEVAKMLWEMKQKGFNNVTTNYKDINLTTADLKNATTKDEAINNLSDVYIYKLAYYLVKRAHRYDERDKGMVR
jgi:hypothetical protein